MTDVPVAATLLCARCGGNFMAWSNAPSARCPYCGTDQPLPAGLRQNLSEYQARVAGELRLANEAYGEAEALQRLADLNSPRRKAPWIALGVATIVPALIVGLGLGAFSLGLVGADVKDLLGASIMVASYGGIAAYLVIYFAVKRRPTTQAAVEAVRVACPTCGAPSELAPGQSAQGCRYCHGVLIASPAVMRGGLAEATLARRRAQLEKHRQAREATVNFASTQRYTPYLMAMSYASMPVVITGALVVATVEAFDGSAGNESYRPAIPIVWTVYAALVTVGLGFWMHLRSRRAAHRRAILDVGLALGGTFESDTRSLVDWLNRVWPADYDLALLGPGPSFSLETTWGGFPALVHVRRRSFQYQRCSLNVLIAADVPLALTRPGAFATIPAARAAEEQCIALGFVVRVEEAGVFASATPATATLLEKSPQRLLDAVPLSHALYALARSIGACPYQPRT